MHRPHRSLLLVFFAFCSLICGDLYARDTLVSVGDPDSLINDSSKLIVRMERREIQHRAIYDTLAITLQAVDYPVAGFDLCFGTSSPYLDIVSVLPGEIIDSCSWEYFTTKQIPTEDMQGHPRVLWKAIGLAEMVPDSSRPKCYGLKREASLVRVVVSNKHVLHMPETDAAIYFFWMRCSDNSLSSATGAKLALSSSVLDYIESENPDTSSEKFPTRMGAPKSCINPASLNKPSRIIQFHNGGIKFTYAAKTTSPEAKRSTTVPAKPKPQSKPLTKPK